ncbi:hypothetical protein [Mucilaginibacter sp.]|uniref:hypothetical protein n=1 Tax=Mucilaginibacter sp. TaxID=1882438 RepID=UPI0032667AAC
MLKKFENKFGIVSKSKVSNDLQPYKSSFPEPVFEVINLYGGITISNGLYRIHTFESSLTWAKNIEDYFIAYRDLIVPFGFDWMGRQFCMNKQNTQQLYMFDPSSGEDFELGQNVLLFHENDLVDDTDAMLSDDLFLEALKWAEVPGLNYDECLTPKNSLLLGGEDILEEYEVSDLDVHWHIHDQIYNQIKDLPPGTKINSIKID